MASPKINKAFDDWSAAHHKYVTARSGLEHKQRAFRLGASGPASDSDAQPASNAEADEVEMLRLRAENLLEAFLQLCARSGKSDQAATALRQD
jgi:hypothetical protein